MSSLTDIEKRYLEKALGMGGGYVLDFTDSTFGEFFERHNVDIHGSKYQTFGTSKAKKLRAFWASEPDPRVGAVLSEMLDSYEASAPPPFICDHAALCTTERVSRTVNGAAVCTRERDEALMHSLIDHTRIEDSQVR